MSYATCPSCKTCLGNRFVIYETKINEICNNNSLTEEEKNTAKSKILDILHVDPDRYCCRMRLMTLDDKIHLLK